MSVITLQEFHLLAAKLRLKLSSIEDSCKEKTNQVADSGSAHHTSLFSVNTPEVDSLNLTEEYVKSNEWESLKSKLILDNTILQRENLNIKQKNDAIVRTLYETKETIHVLKDDIKKERQNTEKINIDYTNKMNDMKTIERNMKLLGSEYDMLSNQFNKLQDQNNELKSKNQLLLTNHQSSLQQILNKNIEIDQLKSTVQDMKKNETKLENDILQQSIRFNILQSETSANQLKSQNEFLTLQNQSLNDRLSSSQEQINSYVTELQSLESNRKMAQDIETAAMESVRVMKNAEISLIQRYLPIIYFNHYIILILSFNNYFFYFF